MIFFLVLAVYFYIPAHEKNSNWHYLFVGILIGISAIMRQTGAILLFVIILHRFYNRDILKRLLQSIGILIIGVLISIIPIIIYFQAVNALTDAIYGIILYKLSYSYGFTLFKTLEIFINQVFLQNVILWIVGLGGALFALERRNQYDFFLVTWFLISFLGIIVMSTPYDHYYIQGMPAISLLGGIFVERLIKIHEKIVKGSPQSKAFASTIKWLLVSFALIGSLMYGVSLYLDMKYVHGLPYQIEAADYIKSHTSPDETILSPDAAYYLLTDRENKYKLAQLSVGNIESFGISDLPQFLESGQIRYIILDQHAVRWRFNEESYRNFFNDEIRAVEVKIVFEWILENYVLERTFGSGIEEIYIYHSQFW
jgi:hypothetical protein